MEHVNDAGGRGGQVTSFEAPVSSAAMPAKKVSGTLFSLKRVARKPQHLDMLQSSIQTMLDQKSIDVTH
jgi:hypothetical protein